MKRTLLLTGGAVLSAVLLTACAATAPANRGRSGYRMDPTHDAASELDTVAPRGQDLVTATDRMAQDIAAEVRVTDPDRPSRIVVGRIENHSSWPERDYQVFLARLRAQLQRSGARHGLEFIRERGYIEQQRDREYGGRDAASTGEAYTSRADYVLTCEIFDFPSGGTNYFLFDYQLVQLREAETGPDVGPGAIVWENSYEVKFQ